MNEPALLQGGLICSYPTPARASRSFTLLTLVPMASTHFNMLLALATKLRSSRARLLGAVLHGKEGEAVSEWGLPVLRPEGPWPGPHLERSSLSDPCFTLNCFQ